MSIFYSFYIRFLRQYRKQASLWIQGDIFKTRKKDVNANGKVNFIGDDIPYKYYVSTKVREVILLKS